MRPGRAGRGRMQCAPTVFLKRYEFERVGRQWVTAGDDLEYAEREPNIHLIFDNYYGDILRHTAFRACAVCGYGV